LVVGFACAAYAEVQNVKVSGDLTVYGILRELDLSNDQGAVTPAVSDEKEQDFVSISRVRIDADLTDNVTTTFRLVNERYWGNNDETADNSDIDIDLAYVTLKEFLYSPVTLMVGRQELHFGDDMIVGDPFAAANPSSMLNGADEDLSMMKAFDAIRMVLNYDPLVIDVVTAKVEEGALATDDDINLHGINLNYTLNKDITLEGYWFQKHEKKDFFTNTKKPRRTDTIGARLVATPSDSLTYKLESAYQFGRYHEDSAAAGTAAGDHAVEQRAWALETSLDYAMKNAKYVPSFGAVYAYFSGDDDDYDTRRGRHKAWDPMFENQAFGDIVNALFTQSNMHIVGIKASMKPSDDLTLKGEYYYYWFAKEPRENATITNQHTNANLTTTNKANLGQEFDLKAVYDYTEDVQFGLLTGVFVPGTAFNGNNRDTATEVIGSMKVTF